MKKKVAVIFGGRSAEHEVSLRSAKNVANALDKNKFELLLIGISQQGSWYQFPDNAIFDQITALRDHQKPASAQPVSLICTDGQTKVFNLSNQKSAPVDIAFPVLHGTFGEDGCIQGLFKMMNLPFVGCGVLGSALGMDKEVMKRLLKEANIASARYEVIHAHAPPSFDQLREKLGLPFFIKPANAGSSVGVHKIKSADDFKAGLKDALLYDHKILAEEFMEGRELECSVMGPNHHPKASVAGEVTPQHEFYSYEAKYIDEHGATLRIPAPLSKEELSEIQKIACKTFQVLGCDGMARVDFFLKKSGQFMINEINTIPGFTQISMYPKMWEATGISYSDLITQLIDLGFEKFRSEEALMTNYDRLND